MSTSASASKIPNIKILKKSRKSDLLEDRLLLLVEQDVVVPRDKQTVEFKTSIESLAYWIDFNGYYKNHIFKMPPFVPPIIFLRYRYSLE
jgi:hypothetical protein